MVEQRNKGGKKGGKWTEWIEKGVLCIHDIVNEHGAFLTKEDMERKYNFKCDDMKFNMIKSAIPMKWKGLLRKVRVPEQAISSEENPHVMIKESMVDLSLLTNKLVYWSIIERKKISPVVCAKWEQALAINKDEWTKIFLNMLVVRETKLRTFQYKVIYNLIPCGLYLNRIGRADSDKCPECGELDEITHYFAECRQLQTFWQSFANWWAEISQSRIEIDTRVIMFGDMSRSKLCDEYNVCIIVAKWHIYKEKLAGNKPFFYKFLCQLKYHLAVERCIAIRNNSIQKFERKWEAILDEIT